MTPRFSPPPIAPLFASSALIICISMPVAAQEPPPKLWSGDIEFGYVSTTGNTEESTAKSRMDVNREKNNWRYNIIFESLNSESNGRRSAEKYFASNRLAYQYTDTNFMFASLSYDDDDFSGFDYQTTATAGWGRRLVNNKTMQWDVGAGPGYRYSKVDDSTNDEDSEALVLSGFTKFVWDFSETANFFQSLTIEAGEDGNTISKSISALKGQIIGSLSLKLSYTIKYTDEVPVDTKHADTESAVTVAYSF